MSPLSKSLLAVLGVSAVVAGTLSLRGGSAPAPRPQLTASQLAELQPPAKPEPPKATAKPVNDPSDLPPPPDDEPDLEDGNGS
jgi:hypothetical protein